MIVFIQTSPEKKDFSGTWGWIHYYLLGGEYSDGLKYNRDGEAVGRAPNMGYPDFGTPVKKATSIWNMIKNARKWFTAAKSVRIFTQTAKDGDLIFYSTKVGDDIIEFGGNFSKSGDVLTIKNLDIDGALTNKLGVKGIRDLVTDFGKQQGVKQVIIEGAKRTTGANPGKTPSRLIFNIE